jgi:hypothetical protein
VRTIFAAKCVRRENQLDTRRWARDLVAHPSRYGADERTRGIVADLLLSLESGR